MQTELSVVHTLVFGATAMGGNPCPVVFGADQLSTEQMRALAVQFNSETAFVLPPTTPAANLRLRYFVPEYEMEMCVHATIGALTVLYQQNQLQCPFAIETPLGIVQANWQQQGELEILLDQFTPAFFDHNPTKTEVASVLQIPEAAILDAYPVQSVSTSRPKLMIPIRDWQTLDAINPNFEQLWQLCDTYQTTGFYPFTLQCRSRRFDAEARQFPKRAGYNEDPATGVAASALAAYLTRYQLQPEQSRNTVRQFSIGQGYAMGKPSRIFAQVHLQNGEITRVQVGGTAVVGARETRFVNDRMN